MSDRATSSNAAPLAVTAVDAPGVPGSGAGPVREALLRAARDELAAHGVGGLSLRAVARRAGVSHAAPKHHFGDRAGLLTVLAADGHHRLTAALARARGERGDERAAEVVARLGRTYLDFGLDEPTLFELMFRSEALHPEDPTLLAARRDTLQVLIEAVGAASAADDFGGDEPVEQLAVICWAFVHGLVVLVGDGALDSVASQSAPRPALSDRGRLASPSATLARTLTDTFIRGLRGTPGPVHPDRG